MAKVKIKVSCDLIAFNTIKGLIFSIILLLGTGCLLIMVFKDYNYFSAIWTDILELIKNCSLENFAYLFKDVLVVIGCACLFISIFIFFIFTLLGLRNRLEEDPEPYVSEIEINNDIITFVYKQFNKIVERRPININDITSCKMLTQVINTDDIPVETEEDETNTNDITSCETEAQAANASDITLCETKMQANYDNTACYILSSEVDISLKDGQNIKVFSINYLKNPPYKFEFSILKYFRNVNNFSYSVKGDVQNVAENLDSFYKFGKAVECRIY